MDLGIQLYFENKTVYISRESMKRGYNGIEELFQLRYENINICWRFTPYQKGFLISLQVGSDAPLEITRMDSLVFTVDPPRATDRIVFLGRDMYGNEIRYPHELGINQEYREGCVGLFSDLSEEGVLLAGVVPYGNLYTSVVRPCEDGRFRFSACTEFTDGAIDSCELQTERTYVSFYTTIDDFAETYRDLLPESSFEMPKLTGWNTWDYYADRVTPEDIFENVTALKSMPFVSQLDYIVIDDGWQKAWGEWRENQKFACGLASVAAKLCAEGFLPGIWMAPLAVKEGGTLLREHPEWFCRDRNKMFFQDMGFYYLDPTHPEVERFIIENYRYQYLAGFRLFKMDYISPLLKVKRFYDKNATPYSAILRLLNKIKQCVGVNSVILGCSLPLECGANVAQSMRIAVDIHNYFSHVIWIAQALAWSWMYNNKTTRIDMDFMVVRGSETTNESVDLYPRKRNDFVPPPKSMQTDEDRFQSRWCHGNPFNGIEAETWANLVAVSGGNLFLSDRMNALNQKGIEIIENAFRISGKNVRPIYQTEDARLPSVWEGDLAILIINWDDAPKSMTYTGVKRPMRSTKPFVLEDESVTVTLLPHESIALEFCDDLYDQLDRN